MTRSHRPTPRSPPARRAHVNSTATTEQHAAQEARTRSPSPPPPPQARTCAADQTEDDSSTRPNPADRTAYATSTPHQHRHRPVRRYRCSARPRQPTTQSGPGSPPHAVRSATTPAPREPSGPRCTTEPRTANDETRPPPQAPKSRTTPKLHRCTYRQDH
jgi:hypothetical protein